MIFDPHDARAGNPAVEWAQPTLLRDTTGDIVRNSGFICLASTCMKIGLLAQHRRSPERGNQQRLSGTVVLDFTHKSDSQSR
jgi:hypothetical protein